MFFNSHVRVCATLFTHLCSFPPSDPEHGDEEEAGGDLGQEEDQDAPPNLYAWIHR